MIAVFIVVGFVVWSVGRVRSAAARRASAAPAPHH